ncbi:hypothetical protein T492DRAFT_1142691 [Pavlovales sp. CCMP2436]|nr:hypothetical protein T492DRAFT_1142691 [Pavlovales sp. CCMP2436]
MMEIQEAPLTRAESVVPPKKKPFSRTNPTLQALVMPAGPTKLSDAIERKDREKPDTIATEHIESLLAEMDDDNTGYVERGQFRRYVKRKGWPISDDKIDEMFDEADGNGDGRLDFLELQAAASGRFKKRIHKHEWFNFLSAGKLGSECLLAIAASVRCHCLLPMCAITDTYRCNEDFLESLIFRSRPQSPILSSSGHLFNHPSPSP